MPIRRVREMMTALGWWPALAFIGLATGAGFGQDDNLAEYFGFEPLEIIKVGRGAGPLAAADMNGDGLTDLLVVNDDASRIEIHEQIAGATPDDSLSRPVRVNEFPEHWRFHRRVIPVTHRVAAVVAHDYDRDGLMDLVYSGVSPSEIVFVRQVEPGRFDVRRRHRVKDLGGTRDGLAIADVLGDTTPELLATVGGDIHVWPLDGDRLGSPRRITAGAGIVALILDDLDGDGRADIVGVAPDDAAPVRVWLGGADGVIAAQQRFEMPPLTECTSVRLPGFPAARLAVIERPAQRIVVHELTTEEIEESGERDAAMSIYGFSDPGNREREHAVVDADGDGLLDLVVTDTEANALVLYRQRGDGGGFGSGDTNPSLSELSRIAAGNVDDDPEAEIFVLSEKEGVVGRCDVTDGRIPFPEPLTISPGHTPTALNLVWLEDGPRVAVVAQSGRDYVLDLIDMTGSIETIELGKMSRSPESIVGLDADQDGRTDLLLFTREKPMTVLHAIETGFELTESKDMGQYGLVKAATADNIASYDIDGDGRDELLFADQNFVRAVRYEPDPRPGISPGWQVVTQVNARRPTSELVSVAIMGDRIVAADREYDQLVIMGAGADGKWDTIETLSVRGFSMTDVHAGAIAGDTSGDILAISEDGFAVIRMSGERFALREVGTWRSRDDREVPHELGSGDINGDGFTDLIALDAGEQMCELFTFSRAGHLLHATGFQVYDSQVFSGPETREFEPSQVLVEDVTGDGADDLVLLAHDRVLIYPQMTED